MLENLERVARAGVYEEVPASLAAVENSDPTLLADDIPPESDSAEQRSSSRYVAEGVVGPGVAILAESHDPSWRASVEGERLERADAGWANGFEVPDDVQGSLAVSYPRTAADIIWLIAVGLGWIVVTGGAFSRRRPAGRSGT